MNDGNNENLVTMTDGRTAIRTWSLQSISYEHHILSMVVTNSLYHSVLSIVEYWLCAYCKVTSLFSVHFLTSFHCIRHVPFIERDKIIFTLYSTACLHRQIFTLRINQQLVEALRYKQEGRRFDSRWCHWNFSLT